MTLNIKAEAEALRTMYTTTAAQNKWNFLLLGESGSGKTSVIATAPRPIHIFSFDPGGTKCPAVRRGISEGWITADTRYEQEDYLHPSSYRSFAQEYNRLGKGGFFENLGTVAIDSFTFYADAYMNSLCPGGKKAEFGEWDKFLKGNLDFVRSWCNLPCNTIMTCHLSSDKDELSGRITSSLLVSGQSARKIPPLVDEVYVMQPKETAKGIDYLMQVQSSNKYSAATRLEVLPGDKHKDFQGAFIKPDLFGLMQAAGIKIEHKANL